jgi:hypothetical protein
MTMLGTNSPMLSPEEEERYKNMTFEDWRASQPKPMGGWFGQATLSNPMETGIARRATPAEVQAGGFVPGQTPQSIAPSPHPLSIAAPPAQMPSTVGNAMSGGLRSPAGMMGGMLGGGNPSGSGLLKSIWEASPQGMTAPNQPYRPFTGQPQQQQRTSSFGMPQQSSAGTGSGYRRMRAPNGEERDIHESQGQHFLSRGGRWV